MSRPQSIYDSPRLAATYAHDRPPVHPHIIRAIGTHLHLTTRVARALDIGCGAGLSTAALEPLAETVVGLEPVRVMVAQGCAEVRDWCHRTFSPVFGHESLDVLFDCYVAYVRRRRLVLAAPFPDAFMLGH